VPARNLPASSRLPVGDHRARIAGARRARLVPAANRAAVREGAHASQILVISERSEPRDGAVTRGSMIQARRPSKRRGTSNDKYSRGRDSKSLRACASGLWTATTEIRQFRTAPPTE